MVVADVMGVVVVDMGEEVVGLGRIVVWMGRVLLLLKLILNFSRSMKSVGLSGATGTWLLFWITVKSLK
jgi:hypothetical protein